MHYLMGYKMPVVESKSGVEHSVVAADGKRYGIIKEGTKFYVKVSDAAKENIAESYEYINGVLAKKENELIDSCDYSCETSSHASGESWRPISG